MTQLSVLTGDLIDSSKLSPAQLDGAMQALAEGAQDITRWAPDMVSGFARSGGDGWQFAVSKQILTVRISLYLRAVLRRQGKRVSTRIAIASGPGTLPPDGNPNAASGPAFTASGRLLGTLSGPHASMAHASGGALHALVLLADHISQGWTPAQARALCQMLPPNSGTHAQAAQQLGISRQAVDQALAAAGYHALTEALEALEAQG